MKFRHVESKSQKEIVHEWDLLAPIRFHQLMDRKDFTFWHVLMPTVFSLLEMTNSRRVLDAGCGVGVMTNLLGEIADEISGVDPSPRSIEIARENFGDETNFFCASLEEFAERSATQVDSVIANMVLMDVLDLRAFLDSAYSLLRPGGSLIFTITHPCFWPEYYGYAGERWFRYDREAIIESPFRISSQQDGKLNSTHIHRPLELYLDILAKARFTLQILREPMPSKNVMNLYPEPWRTPRYLVGVAQRQRHPTKIQRIARKTPTARK